MLSYFHQFNLIFNQNYLLNNFLLTLIFIFTLLFILLNSNKLIISSWNSFILFFFNFFKSQIFSLIDLKIKGLSLLIFSIFNLVLFINILGLFPYIFSITSHISFTMFISLTIWFISLFIGLNRFRLNFFSIFVPLGCPLLLGSLLSVIETLSFLSRIISLGLRLAVNIFAGHLLLVIIGSFGFKILFLPITFFYPILISIPIFILIFVILLEISMSIIQSFVISLLSTIYICENFNLH